MEVIFGRELEKRLEEAFLLAGNTIFIVSPYMSEIYFDKKTDMTTSGFMEMNALEEDARYIIITDISQECSISFLDELKKKVYEPNLYVFNLPNLHSKMYLFPGFAFVGSFNFTHKGVMINHEFGMFIDEEEFLNKLRDYSGILIKKSEPKNENAKSLFKNIDIQRTESSDIYNKICSYLDKIGWNPITGKRGDGKS